MKDLTRIFHTDRNEEAAKADGVRQTSILMPGCMCTYCPNQNVSLTQHPSGFPASAGDRHEIYGLRSFILTNTLGTCLEYLDATLYAFFSTIIAGIFFPEENPKLALLLTFAVFAISFIVLPVGALLFGFFGDRFGQRNNHYGLRSVLFSAALAMTLVALLPFYLVTTTHNTALILGSFGILAIIVAAFDGPLAAYLVSKFDVSVRHSGVSLSYNVGTAVFAGITPFILTYATDKTGITYFPSFFLISFALLACFIL